MRAVPPQRHLLFNVTVGEKGCNQGSFVEAMFAFTPEVAIYENIMGFDCVISKSY